MAEQSHFFALISRMRHIERWALMRTSTHDNLAEHSLEVAMIAHALATIANIRYEQKLDAEKAALIAIYHDSTEIITGDMPTPVKYYDEAITAAYKAVEGSAANTLIEKLPEDLQDAYQEILAPDEAREESAYLVRIVKAADKISAYIKCVEEEAAGNAEFARAKEALAKTLSDMADEMPEVGDFLDEFLSSYGKTLDELLG